MSNRERINILSLNGGGVRGLFTVSVLAEFERIQEEKTGKPTNISDFFDLFCGTSIGGLLALGLAKGKSAIELETKFRSQALSIFPHRYGWYNTIKSAFRPKYTSTQLAKTVESILGKDTRFNELQRRAIVPTVNLSTGKPQFFKTPHNPEFTRDGRIKLVDAAMATSAAPTYFPPHYCSELDAYFADGGLCANNPSFVGLHEVLRDMKSDFPDAKVEDIHILNIGTLGEGYSLSPASLEKKRGYLNLWGIGERLVLTTMTANQQLHKNMLKRELLSYGAAENYVYVDDTVPNEAASDITIDNASDSSLKNLSSRGKQVATEVFTQDERVRTFFKSQVKPFQRKNLE